MIKEHFKITLLWADMIAPKVRHFACARQDEQPFDYINGQFISLHFQDAEGEFKRSYSVATRRDRSQEIEFAASLLEGGRASDLLAKLQPGDTLTASGPFGRLILSDEKPSRYILVATGTGVTPYRAMLAEIATRMKEDPALHVVLLFGAQYRTDLLYSHEFVEFAKTHSRFEFRAHLSREILHQPEDHEYSGHVQTSFNELALNPDKDIVYLCGNPNMIDEAFIDLKERGFTNANVRREKYISGK